jgi:hypothetical protein
MPGCRLRAYAYQSYNKFRLYARRLSIVPGSDEAVVARCRASYDRKRRHLGLEALRPWDVNVDASGQPPLQPLRRQDKLIQGH